MVGNATLVFAGDTASPWLSRVLTKSFPHGHQADYSQRPHFLLFQNPQGLVSDMVESHICL